MNEIRFDLEEAVQSLERTPRLLAAWLPGLADGWLHSDEGDGTWNAVQVVEHLIEGEKVNWTPRLEWMLKEGESKPFPPFDRDAHLRERDERPLDEKLREFAELRAQNIGRLRELVDGGSLLERTGCHPAFGTVKVRELLSTWVVHDFTHIAQIARVFAERYRADVGPWRAYLGIYRPRVK